MLLTFLVESELINQKGGRFFKYRIGWLCRNYLRWLRSQIVIDVVFILVNVRKTLICSLIALVIAIRATMLYLTCHLSIV
jgi:hypothetical protein